MVKVTLKLNTVKAVKEPRWISATIPTSKMKGFKHAANLLKWETFIWGKKRIQVKSARLNDRPLFLQIISLLTGGKCC